MSSSFFSKKNFILFSSLYLVVRFIAAFSNFSYAHPDEWFQTVELANLILNSKASFTHEITLHLRNLSWPLILTVPLLISKTLFPASLSAPWITVQVFVGTLDFIFFYLIWDRIKSLNLKNHFEKFAFLFLLGFSAFLARDGIRPSQEHLSAIAFLLALFFIDRKNILLFSFFLVATAAFRYPSALLSAGALIAFFLKKENRQPMPMFKLSTGIACGLILFGISDWIFYGRAWESFYLYFQYNVLSGLAVKNFGEQSITVYLRYFWGHWKFGLFLLFIPATLFSVKWSLGALKKKSILAYSIIFYLIGHFLIAHKEPRFMIPVEPLLILGFIEWLREFDHTAFFNRYRRIVSPVLMALIVINSLLILKIFWGDRFRAASAYYEWPNFGLSPCAVITSKRMSSISFPSELPKYLNVSFAYWPKSSNEFPVIWIEGNPSSCTPDDLVLLQPLKPDSKWERVGCFLQKSSVLKWIEKDNWKNWIQKDRVSGVWYSCPISILSEFKRSESRSVVVHRFHKIDKLPPLSLRGNSLLSFINAHTEKSYLMDGTISDQP